MIEPNSIADRIVALMNEALAADRWAVEQLVKHRVYCNAALADHPTIQCSKLSSGTVGLLGILNGISGVQQDGGGYVVAVMSDEGAIIRFERR